jgi:murein L,D-transpeptidase YcbB/YkuD
VTHVGAPDLETPTEPAKAALDNSAAGPTNEDVRVGRGVGRTMSVFAKRLRTSVGWIVVAALAAATPAARAQTAMQSDAGSPTAAPADNSQPPSVLPRDPSVTADLTGVDLSTGSIAKKTPSAWPDTVVEAPRSITRLDSTPSDLSAPEPLVRAPLPPEAPPLSSSAAIAPMEIPLAARPAPTNSPAAPEILAPRRASVEPPDTSTAPASLMSPAETPGASTNVAAPASGTGTSSEIAVAIDGALASLLAQSPTVSPVGAGDWRAARAAIRGFYADKLFAPLWVDAEGLTPRGRAVLGRLTRADEDGLDLAAFALPDPTFVDTHPERLAQVEVTVSAALVAYAMEASGSRIAPANLSRFVTASPSVVDPEKALSETASAAEPGDALAAYNPGQKGYRQLRDELARLRGSSPIAARRPPAGPMLRIGMEDPRVPLIRARFGLGAQTGPNGARLYDARVATAVAAFQRSKGLAADGALTTATSEALFGDPNFRREAAIVANMEMWRWQPRDMGQSRIEINVADYTLHVMNGDEEVHRARVIVGKPDTPTPIFSNEVKYILINPIWRVPDSIIKKEMLPKLANDPNYLAKRGFQVSYVGDRLVVNQPPGEGNALGRILFMFPNEHSVYLHDTPTRGLFATTRRAYSHGCVRVEEPLRLAELLMGGAARGWTAGRFQALLGTSEKAVSLPHPLPIHIEYFTEFIDAAGAAQEREDVYGLTAQVAATLSRLRQY